MTTPIESLFPNPLVLRVFRGHLAAGRKQDAYDLALCFAWRYSPGMRMGALAAKLHERDIDIGQLMRRPSPWAYKSRVGPFIGGSLRSLMDALFESGNCDMDLLRIARKLSASAEDTQATRNRNLLVSARRQWKEARADEMTIVASREKTTAANSFRVNIRGTRARRANWGRLR